MSKKHVEITTTLPKDCEDVIGIPVKNGEDVVGEVVEYDKETGEATIKIKTAIWEQIAGDDKGLLKKLNDDGKNSRRTRKKSR